MIIFYILTTFSLDNYGHCQEKIAVGHYLDLKG